MHLLSWAKSLGFSAPVWRQPAPVLLLVAALSMTAAWRFGATRHAAAARNQPAVAVVSAASFERVVAPDSVAAAFGERLATSAMVAGDIDPVTPGVQFPVSLAGTTVEINSRLAQLFFVSPSQVNFLVPAATEINTVSVVVRAGDGAVSRGEARIAAVAPGIFSADGNGQGAPAATLLRVNAGGEQSYEALAERDLLLGRFVPIPIKFDTTNERVFLILYLTGIRRAPDPNNDGNLSESARVTIGGTEIAPGYAGQQGFFAGLDQINVELPRSLLGRGVVNVTVSVAGGAVSRPVEIEMAAAAAGAAAPRARDKFVTTNEDEGKPFVLEAFDPGGRPLTRYVITSLPRFGKLSGGAPNLIYTPNPDFFGDDSFTFKVSNGVDLSDNGRAYISVTPVNDAPVLKTPGAQSVSVGERLSFIVTATDADMEPILYFTLDDAGKPPGATLTIESPTSARFSWIPTVEHSGITYTVKITVRDNGQPVLSDTKTVTIMTGFLWAKTSGPEGGTINTLLVSGANIYSGTRDGGVFRSSDAGSNWTSVNAGLGNPTVNALFDTGTRLLAGTNDGVFFSTNQGQSWTATGLRGIPVLSFAVTRTRIFAGTDGLAIRVSNDGGLNWTNVETFDFNGADIGNALLVRGGALFASVDDSAGVSGGIFVTNNDGQIWRRLSGGLPGDGIFSGAALAANDTHLFAAVRRFGVYASSDNGQTWAAANTGLPNDGILALAADGARVYASALSGVFVSVNNGQSWTPINTGFTNRATNAFAFNGANLLVGTLGDGVFLSSDNARSFTAANGGLSNSRVTAFAFDNAGTNLFVGTNRGVLVTGNNGQRYDPVNATLPVKIAGGRREELSINALAVVGPALFAATSDGVYLSANPGQNWMAVNNGLTNLTVNDLAVIGLRVFAATMGGVFVTANQGQNWTAVNSGLANLQVLALTANGASLFAGTSRGAFVSTNQGQSWSSLGLENFSVRRLAVNGAFMAAAGSEGVRVSNNGGLDWREVVEGLPSAFVSALAIRGATAYAGLQLDGVYTLAPDGQVWTTANESLSSQTVNTLVVKDDRLFAGTNDGVSLSTNSSQVWRSSNERLTALNVSAIMHADDSLVIGTAGGGVFRMSEAGRGWEAFNAGLPPNALVFALAASPAAFYAGTAANGVYRSADQGRNWNSFSQGLTNPEINALAVSGSHILAGTQGAGVFRVSDQGSLWESSNAGLTNQIISSLTPGGANLFAGSEVGLIFVSDNQGQSWKEIARLSSQTQPVKSLDVLALFAGDAALFAGTRGAGVYRSRDAGRSWALANNDLPPNLSVSSFAVSGARLYAGTIHGVFVSTDQGGAWRQINAGLASVAVNSLLVRDKKIYAATANGGVFVSEIPD